MTIIQQLQQDKGLKNPPKEESALDLIWYRNRNTFIKEGENLIGLNLCDLGLTDWEVETLFKEEDLSQLQSLNLSENKLTSLTIPASAVELRHINVSENPELRELKLEGPLPELISLEARSCALEHFELLDGFKKLEKFELRKNKLQVVKFKGKCPALTHLHVGQNQLTEFRLPIGFGKLEYLYLLDNEIKSVHFASRLPELKTLHLRNNKLEDLPSNLLYMDKLETLYLYNNPLPNIPKEVIATGERENSKESIWNYLKSAQDGFVPLHQAKMILVGNGEVGKTSICLKLQDVTYPLPEKEDRTEGLEVVPYTIYNLEKSITGLESLIDFQMSIWDFGGQGKYREVQQLFCSRKSLYLFVTCHDDNPDKEDYIGFEYWLSMVQAYGFDKDDHEHQYSPVIHVVNKIDQKPMPIDQKYRLQVFPNIYPDFIQISCKTLKNFEDLRTAIRKALPYISPRIFKDQYSALWLEVKSQLEEMPENHISYKDYESLCLQNQMNESEARTWIQILDRIGTVIYFGDHPELKDWVILKPSWVKDALFQVVKSKLVERGIMVSSHYEYIWPKNTPEERKKFVALMVAYKLAYQEKDRQDRVSYVIPALLSNKKPHFPPQLQQIDYQFKILFDPFVPAGTVNRLLVYLQQGERHKDALAINREMGEVKGIHTHVETYYKWKNNIVLHAPAHHAYAHLEEKWEDKAVFINLYGKNARPLFDYAIQALEKINQEMVDAKYMGKLDIVPLAWHKEAWRKLSDLMDLGIDYFTTDQPETMNLIKNLIKQGRLEKALEELENQLSGDNKNEATQLLTRLNDLNRDIRKGIVSRQNATTERNQISSAAIDLSDLIDKSIPGKSEEDLPPDMPSPGDRTSVPPSTSRSKGLKKLKIFLASSDELKEERDALRQFFSVENDRLVDRGIYINLVQWEYGFEAMSQSRLQDEYNKLVQECDAVLSLFFTKAGKFTQEEVEKAWEHFQQTGRPHIFTYFQNADINTGNMNKADLMSLWEFEKKLRDLGHFPSHFTNTDDLCNQFKRQLEHLLGM